MNILGKKVRHDKFGKGVVVGQQENKVIVLFEEGQKLFLFPDAFKEHLVIQDKVMQKKIELLNEYHQKELEKEKQKREREIKYRSKIRTMKIPVKSQVAYDISEDMINDLEFLNTGYLLGGKLKGSARKPVNIQPNTAVLMTDCINEERNIIGVVMTSQFFWGKECEDGRILLHPKHKIILLEENRVSFWTYFKEEAFSSEWGKVPYKYFDTKLMHDIIYDICCRALHTEQEEELYELYSYFCSINRILEQTIEKTDYIQ